MTSPSLPAGQRRKPRALDRKGVLVAALLLGVIFVVAGGALISGTEEQHREDCAVVAERTDQTVEEFQECAKSGVAAVPAAGIPLTILGGALFVGSIVRFIQLDRGQRAAAKARARIGP